MFLINTNFRQMLFNAGNIPDGKKGYDEYCKLQYLSYDLWLMKYIFDFGNCPEKNGENTSILCMVLLSKTKTCM